jgi:hypothetical protein
MLLASSEREEKKRTKRNEKKWKNVIFAGGERSVTLLYCRRSPFFIQLQINTHCRNVLLTDAGEGQQKTNADAAESGGLKSNPDAVDGGGLQTHMRR